ncbi:MAG TPA: 2-phospho-L-lactate transferase [Acidimicrobiia bacterium]
MRVTELSGGVGGARLARGLARLENVDLTLIVNVGDDELVHGLSISPDLDTVLYTLAGLEGPEGWGRRDDTFVTNDEIGRFGLDNRFRLGDLDLALNLYRSSRLSAGDTLTEITAALRRRFELKPLVLPASNDELRTEVRLGAEDWISFQEYFVFRQHRDEVTQLRFRGSSEARPAPGVLESLEAAEVVLIAPSNPPLSIWPILAVPGIQDAVANHPRVVAVSPLFGGRALKGPADRVMASLGLPPGNPGVAQAYDGLIDALVVDARDEAESGSIEGVEVIVADTLITDPEASARLSAAILGL